MLVCVLDKSLLKWHKFEFFASGSYLHGLSDTRPHTYIRVHLYIYIYGLEASVHVLAALGSWATCMLCHYLHGTGLSMQVWH